MATSKRAAAQTSKWCAVWALADVTRQKVLLSNGPVSRRRRRETLLRDATHEKKRGPTKATEGLPVARDLRNVEDEARHGQARQR